MSQELKARKSGLGSLINFNGRMLKLGIERIVCRRVPDPHYWVNYLGGLGG